MLASRPGPRSETRDDGALNPLLGRDDAQNVRQMPREADAGHRRRRVAYSLDDCDRRADEKGREERGLLVVSVAVAAAAQAEGIVPGARVVQPLRRREVFQASVPVGIEEEVAEGGVGVGQLDGGGVIVVTEHGVIAEHGSCA